MRGDDVRLFVVDANAEPNAGPKEGKVVSVTMSSSRSISACMKARIASGCVPGSRARFSKPDA